MNCCNEFGHCVQGPNCAARAYRFAPAQVAKARALRNPNCDERDICQGHGCADCHKSGAALPSAERRSDVGGGNVWFVGDEPTDEPPHPPRSAGTRASIALVAIASCTVSVITINALFGDPISRWLA